MMRLRHFLSFQRLLHSTSKCTEAAKTSKENLPSSSFLRDFVKTTREKEKLAQLITERQMLDEFFSENDFRPLNDTDWQLLLKMTYAQERAEYFLSLRRGLEAEQTKEEYIQTQQAKFDAGEMVYGKNFHNLIELFGRDFRAVIDKVYGSRIISKEKTDTLSNLIVDCRYLSNFTAATQHYFLRQFETIHTNNWFSKDPFKGSNFLYGPERLKEENAESFAENETFTQIPFRPTLSNKRLSDHADLHGDSAMYVSWKATRFLPDEPPANLKDIIICATDDYHPATSSSTACAAEKIVPYRIPLEKFSRSLPTTRTAPMTLATAIQILRAWTTGTGWERAISENMVSLRLTDAEWKAKRDISERTKLFKMAMLDSEIMYRQHRIDEKQAQLNEGSKKQLSDDTHLRPKIKHRYSREERNTRRASEAAAQLKTTGISDKALHF
ncbi:unnamed protein product, partial [Mesorhabditis belari]|uniref:SAM-dependent MTase TRM10-type domain-containing protein n=1 Tax=Mesorhabditis belari TaxID=2138241 RepID=A0AAF3ELC9_9BILA